MCQFSIFNKTTCLRLNDSVIVVSKDFTFEINKLEEFLDKCIYIYSYDS